MKKPCAMIVTRFDNLLRYNVSSRSRPEVQHLVELDTYNGNGRCACEYFTFKLDAFLRKGAPAGDNLRCEHIKAARMKLADDIIRQAAKTNGGTAQTKRNESAKTHRTLQRANKG